MYSFLAEEFNQLNTVVPNIHYGGCCVFAEKLFKFLEALGKEPKVVIITEPFSFTETIIKERQYHNRDSCFFIVVHAVIKVDNVYIDNNGFYTETKQILHCEKDRLINFEIGGEDIKWVNKTISGWNPRFNREQIPVINKKFTQLKRKVKKHLEVKK